MKLIDEQALSAELHDEYHGMISDSELKIFEVLQMLEAAPAIDPVHAAGGCYCRECLKKDTESCPMVEFEYVCPGDTPKTLFTANYSDGFCNYGEHQKGVKMDSQELFEKMHEKMMQTMKEESTSGEMRNPVVDTIERLEAENTDLRQQLAEKEIELQTIRTTANQFKQWCQEATAERDSLREQIARKDKQIKQWENALSAFDDGVEPTQDVMDLLSNPDELKRWIARAAWHCKKVHDQNAEIEKLKTDLVYVTAELDAAKTDIAALIWLNGNCEFCLFGTKEEYSGANRWTCKLDSRTDCCPEWRGLQQEDGEE